MQPWTAYLGLFGICIIFVLANAMWWDKPATLAKVLGAYGAVRTSFCLFFWLFFKYI
jgi:hypothetical protein